MIQTRQENNEVYYAVGPIAEVQKGDIVSLKQKAVGNERRRIRLCTHQGVDEKLHEMLIIHYKGAYVRPHKHLNKSESFHVIEGAVDVILFDDAGKLIRVMPMGPFASGFSFYYRLSEPLYHTLLIRSEVLVFHETTNGPFNRDETIFAPWAPEENDPGAVANFVGQVEMKARDFHNQHELGIASRIESE